jgi:hypothetical protein
MAVRFLGTGVRHLELKAQVPDPIAPPSSTPVPSVFTSTSLTEPGHGTGSTQQDNGSDYEEVDEEEGNDNNQACQMTTTRTRTQWMMLIDYTNDYM